MSEAIDLQAARAAIDAERNQRVAACNTDIQAALERNHCALVPQPVMRPDGTIGAQVLIVAQEVTDSDNGNKRGHS